MAAFQFYQPAPVFTGLTTFQPIAGGFLHFYDIGTTNPRNTWSDPALDAPHLNANPVPLDAAGRADEPIFLDGEYTVVAKDALGATIWTRDVIPGGNAALNLPLLDPGEFLTGDGTNYTAATIRQMPDATGSTGQIPVTNGGGANGYTLQDIPDFTPPDPEIEVTATTFQAGVSTDDTKRWEQFGTGTAPNTGTKFSNLTVSLSPAIDNLQIVHIMINTASTTPAGEIPTWSVTGVTLGGSNNQFTVNFNIPDDDSSSSHKFSTTIPFAWHAIGTREIP